MLLFMLNILEAQKYTYSNPNSSDGDSGSFSTARNFK